MKKTRMMMFSLVLFGLLLVAVPAKAASIDATESTASALSSLASLPVATALDDGWAVLGALVVALPGAFYLARKPTRRIVKMPNQANQTSCCLTIAVNKARLSK